MGGRVVKASVVFHAKGTVARVRRERRWPVLLLLIIAILLAPMGGNASLLSPLITVGTAFATRHDEDRSLFWVAVALTVLIVLVMIYVLIHGGGHTFSTSSAS
jgi:uncharacterized membrane protein YhaH (DUF805 family)